MTSVTIEEALIRRVPVMSSCSGAYANDILQCPGKNQEGGVGDSEVKVFSGNDEQAPMHGKVETGKLEDRESAHHRNRVLGTKRGEGSRIKRQLARQRHHCVWWIGVATEVSVFTWSSGQSANRRWRSISWRWDFYQSYWETRHCICRRRIRCGQHFFVSWKISRRGSARRLWLHFFCLHLAQQQLVEGKASVLAQFEKWKKSEVQHVRTTTSFWEHSGGWQS